MWLTQQKRRITKFFNKKPTQIIYITEHHLTDEELEGVTLQPCTLGAKFCK
jgi:hypothetical protein